MEETQNQAQETPQMNEERVSFPTVGSQEKKNGGAKTLLIIGILVLVGILGYVIYKSASGKTGDVTVNTEPTPYENMAAPQTAATSSPSATILPSPSSSPSTKIDRSKVKIQVQNGTGITGEAAYLQNILKGLGYTNVTTGNSATQDETDTQVSFASSVSSDIVDEITLKLNTTYETVKKTNSTSTTYDVVIITGLKKGATPKPTATPAE